MTLDEAQEALFHEMRGRLLEVQMKQYTEPAQMSLYVKSMSDKLHKRIREILTEFNPPRPGEQSKADPIKPPHAAPAQRR